MKCSIYWVLNILLIFKCSPMFNNSFCFGSKIIDSLNRYEKAFTCKQEIEAADINSTDWDGQTVLILAMFLNKDTKFIDFLINKGACVTGSFKYGSPISYAIAHADASLLNLMLQKGALVCTHTESGNKHLENVLKTMNAQDHEFGQYSKLLKCAQYLIEQCPPEKYSGLLHNSLRNSNFPMIKLLLSSFFLHGNFCEKKQIIDYAWGIKKNPQTSRQKKISAQIVLRWNQKLEKLKKITTLKGKDIFLSYLPQELHALLYAYNAYNLILFYPNDITKESV